MTIKQLSIFIENRLGRMAEVTELLGAAGVDIRALSIADTSDFGILRLIVDKPDEAVEALKASGATVSLTDVVGVGINDTPGSFAKAMRALADASLGVEYMYAFITRKSDEAFVIMRIENVAEAVAVFEKNGYRLLSGDEIYSI